MLHKNRAVLSTALLLFLCAVLVIHGKQDIQYSILPSFGEILLSEAASSPKGTLAFLSRK